jgi:hypothetical protein
MEEVVASIFRKEDEAFSFFQTVLPIYLNIIITSQDHKSSYSLT